MKHAQCSMRRIAALSLAIPLSACSGGDEDTSTDGSAAAVTVTDATPPVITLRGAETIEVVFGARFRDLGATARDDTDGEVEVLTDGEIDTLMPGTYALTYSATDSSGNSSSRTRSVQVTEDPLSSATISTPDSTPAAAFFDGVLIDAHYWSDKPEILSARMEYADIAGIDAPALRLDVVREARGAWANDLDCGPDTRNYTTASTRDQVAMAFVQQTPYGPLKDGAVGIDGLPIVFSWPVDTRTISPTDFQLTLNTGDIVRPFAVSPFPNTENNERNIVVALGEFGNRLTTGHPDSRFPIKLEIVADDSPLTLVGPDGRTASAVGLTWETSADSPYDTRSPYNADGGPRVIGAKLNRIDGPASGEGVRTPLAAVAANDASALYDEGNFVLRIMTSGSFSPDGVTALKPSDYERFFRIRANGADGSAVLIESVGEEYRVAGGMLRVVGLADLGPPADDGVYYDDCYDEDYDNYIEVVLVGDEEAARNITHLEMPDFSEGYARPFNDGGPGRTPFEDVIYTQGGVSDPEPVIIALEDPMRVTYTPDEQPGYRAALYDTAWPADMANLNRSNSVVAAGLPRDASEETVAIESVEMPYPVFAYTREEDEIFVVGGTSFILDQYVDSIDSLGSLDLSNGQSAPHITKYNPFTGTQTRLDLNRGEGLDYVGGALIHANGYVYVVFQSHLYKIDPDTMTIARSAGLPAAPGSLAPFTIYNGLSASSSGALITKYWTLSGDASEFFLIDPDTLEITARLEYPGASPRLTVAPDDNGKEYLYHLNRRETFRLQIGRGSLIPDTGWRSRYDPYQTGQEENDEPTSPVVLDGRVFYTTNTAFTATEPMRIFWQNTDTGYDLSDPPLAGPELFGDTENGGWSFFHLSIDEHSGIVIGNDQGNGLLTAVRVVDDNQIERLWQAEITTSARPVIVSDREMVYATDFVDGRDHLVVFDLGTGVELLRIPTVATRATISTIIASTANEVYYGSNEPGQPIGLFHRIYVP